MKYLVLKNLMHNGQRYEPGDAVDLEESSHDIPALLACAAIAPEPAQMAAPGTGETPAPPKGAETPGAADPIKPEPPAKKGK